jgi:hypothetical protein
MAAGTSLEIKVSSTEIKSCPKWRRIFRFSQVFSMKTWSFEPEIQKKRHEVEPHMG